MTGQRGDKVVVNLMDYMPTVSAKPTPPAGTKPKPDVNFEIWKQQYGL